MYSNMYFLNRLLAISNGQKIETILTDLPGLVIGSFADGAKYGLCCGTFILETEEIFDREILTSIDFEATKVKDLEYLLEVFKSKALDHLWPLRNFKGWDMVKEKEKILEIELQFKKKIEVFEKKKQAIVEKYPEIPEELKTEVFSLDWYYTYSDDNNVYNKEEKRHDEVKQKLKQIGMESFYAEYENLIAS